MTMEKCDWEYVKDTLDPEDQELVEEELGMTDPYDFWVKSLRALIGADPDVTVVSDDDKHIINICVAGCTKPDAYRLYFPGTYNLRGVGDIKILVNGHEKKHKTIATFDCLQKMFANHPYVKEITASYTPSRTINRIFCIFKKIVIQYKCDTIANPWGVTTTTPEELAHKVMRGSGMTVLWITESDFTLEKYSPDIIPNISSID